MHNASAIPAVVATLLALAQPAVAQNPPPAESAGAAVQQSDRFVVVIVKLDALPDPTARTRVLRRKDMRPQNVILVTGQTTHADLARAITALAASHARHGREIGRTMTTNLGPGQPLTGERGGRLRATLNRTFQLLSASRTFEVEGFGDVPAVVLPTRVSHWAPGAAAR